MQPERIIYAEDNGIRGFRGHKDNDFILGGLFAVHWKDLGISGPENIEAFCMLVILSMMTQTYFLILNFVTTFHATVLTNKYVSR